MSTSPTTTTGTPPSGPTAAVAAATASVAAAAPSGPPRPKINWPETNKNGAPLKGSMMNARRAISILGLDCRHELFGGVYSVQGSLLDRMHGELSDKITRKFREICFQQTRFEPGAEAAREGLLRACEEHQYNELQDALLALKWDGTKRLGNWVVRYLGIEDTDLHREWGRLWLMALARRAFDPGCKFDHVPVLEGREGGGKSTALKILACGRPQDAKPKFFSDSTILDRSEKEQLELLIGVWLYEISEMSGLSRADAKKLKAFISRQEDRARMAYAYFRTNQPRGCVFVGTINTDEETNDIIEYLNIGDRRRWWPFKVGDIDLEALIRDRDQLMAEALHEVIADPYRFEIYLAGQDEWELQFGKEVSGIFHPLTLDPKFYDEAREVQKQREIPDSIADLLSDLYDRLRDRPQYLTIGGGHRGSASVEAIEGRDYTVDDDGLWVSAKLVINLLPHQFTTDGRRMASAMVKNGWSRRNDTRGDIVGKRRGYLHPIE